MAATARYFRVKPETVMRHLKFWWPGKKYLEEFEKPDRRVRWDRPTAELLKALNDAGSIIKAAKTLKTTSITLTKAIQRHGIVQKWVVGGKDGEEAHRGNGRRRRRTEEEETE